MLLLEEDYGKMQLNWMVRQKNSGTKEHLKAEKQNRKCIGKNKLELSS